MRMLNAVCTGFLAGAVLSSVQDGAWGWATACAVGLAAGIANMVRDRDEEKA